MGLAAARRELDLLRPLRIDAGLLGLVEKNVLIVPAKYDARGGLQIKASQLVTRPCARNATLTPPSIQDHMAIGSLSVLWIYARFYHAYLKSNVFSGHVETALAKYLGPHVAVSCIDSIAYTIRR